MDEPPCCPACGDDTAVPIGTLGNLTWFRCRACGMDFSQDDETNPAEPDTHPT